MFYAEAQTKDGFFYNFVENIINKKSYDHSCILGYMVPCEVFKVLKLHEGQASAILKTLKNIACAHISRNAPAFIRFSILLYDVIKPTTESQQISFLEYNHFN